MAEVKHTPGPWMAAAKPSSVVGWPVVAAPIGQAICDVAIINKRPDNISDGEFSAYYAQVEANARLIAAAPDLFEALEAILNTSGARKSGYDAFEYSKAVALAENALSKATAQQEGS